MPGATLFLYGSAQAAPGALIALGGLAEIAYGFGELFGVGYNRENYFKGSIIEDMSSIGEGFRGIDY